MSTFTDAILPLLMIISPSNPSLTNLSPSALLVYNAFFMKLQKYDFDLEYAQERPWWSPMLSARLSLTTIHLQN